MHIPDGYLSPATAAVGFAIAVPTIAIASARVQRTVKLRQVPTLALLAAVSFLVMMFNIPIPDGTTAHAIGAVLIAVLLGPWAAVIGVSVALLFQALLFGDGGVLMLGVNITNMAIIAPFVGYGVYRMLAGGSALTSARRAIAAGVGGYVGINVAALAAAIELGIQPALFHAADGTPLYSPYSLAQTIPAMMLAHLLVAGFVEAAITAGTFAYLQRSNLALLRLNATGVPDEGSQPRSHRMRPGLVALVTVGVVILLTPLGLLAPGGAFGEDAPDELNLGALGLNAVPAGLAKWNGFWQHALFPDYDFANSSVPWLGYIVSALVGAIVVGGVVFGITWLINRMTRGSDASADQQTSNPTPAPSIK